MEYKDRFETDCYVKRYMKKYGIENVRGGTYSNTYLPYYYYKTIEDELADENFQYLQDTMSLIRDIRSKYDSTIYPLEEVKKRLHTSLSRYHDLQSTYDSFMCYFLQENEKNVFHAKKMRIENTKLFEWAESMLYRFEIQESTTESKKDIMIKYQSFLSFCKKMVPFFMEMPDIFKNDSISPINIRHPEFVFDLFFYHAKVEEKEKYEIQFQEAIQLIYYFEYMKNCIFNRMEECEFDLFSHSCHFETETNIALEYIDSKYYPLTSSPLDEIQEMSLSKMC
jgi:hypothetical protein